ncbi:MAG: iron-sulfur cluster assembly accessory protein [Verrucomicrobiales bacterium]|nr:iron-sulfur cluster assembly accessory protein [Verrucomicrobiales bacterium]
MITITDAAAQQLHKMLEGREETGLRLFVEKGGCAGMSYAMKVTSPEATDTVIEKDGVKVFIDKESEEYLAGINLDYVDALNDSGFKIENPNAARSCGCGTSFEPTNSEKQPAYDPETMDGSVCGSEK